MSIYLPMIDEEDDIQAVIGFTWNKYNGTKHIIIILLLLLLLLLGEILHKFNGFNLLHKISTNPGSSGSPVFMITTA